MRQMLLLTLGVYERGEDEFFKLVVKHKVDLFVDVRRARGLRGATYKFANSSYLQARLAGLGIRYYHALKLAPSDVVRAIQDKADKESKTLKRDRDSLSPSFIKAYTREVLRAENLATAMTEIQALTLDKKNPTICLFCVERNHEACHRLLLADALTKRFGMTVKHM